MPVNQHTSPCHDCPWRRNAAQGWLGKLSARQWVEEAHGESFILCHVKAKSDNVATEPQCAGAATFRANVCKLPRDPEQLKLPADRAAVFSNRVEFLNHHER